MLVQTAELHEQTERRGEKGWGEGSPLFAGRKNRAVIAYSRVLQNSLGCTYVFHEKKRRANIALEVAFSRFQSCKACYQLRNGSEKEADLFFGWPRLAAFGPKSGFGLLFRKSWPLFSQKPAAFCKSSLYLI